MTCASDLNADAMLAHGIDEATSINQGNSLLNLGNVSLGVPCEGEGRYEDPLSRVMTLEAIATVGKS